MFVTAFPIPDVWWHASIDPRILKQSDFNRLIIVSLLTNRLIGVRNGIWFV